LQDVCPQRCRSKAHSSERTHTTSYAIRIGSHKQQYDTCISLPQCYEVDFLHNQRTCFLSGTLRTSPPSRHNVFSNHSRSTRGIRQGSIRGPERVSGRTKDISNVRLGEIEQWPCGGAGTGSCQRSALHLCALFATLSFGILSHRL
jgi:hypothetical protein